MPRLCISESCRPCVRERGASLNLLHQTFDELILGLSYNQITGGQAFVLPFRCGESPCSAERGSHRRVLSRIPGISIGFDSRMYRMLL